MKKFLIVGVIGLITIACGDKKKSGSSFVDGGKIYKTNCVICHGEDGKLGLNNSKDLTKSTLSMEDRVEQITNGKGAMTGFGTLLTEEEIKAVAAYTYKLK